MDEQKRTEEEQVEDLDTPQSEAEEVKGGLNFTRSGDLAHRVDISSQKVGIKGELSGLKIEGFDGGTGNHNETLIEI